MTTPTFTLPLSADNVIDAIRAGLPHLPGANISKAAAAAATITMNADGTAAIGIPAAGLSLGAKGGGRKKKAGGEG